MADAGDDDDLIEEVTQGEAALHPGEVADPDWLVKSKLPKDILDRYEVHSYRSAAVILSEGHAELFAEICEALRNFEISSTIIRTAGGNESEVPKKFSQHLRPLGWNETMIRGDLSVKLIAKEQIGLKANGDPRFKQTIRETLREKYLDGHKVDYVKGRVAFDLEWNSKDQTFDRDLYAFSAFAQCGVIDVGVLVTRGISMTPFIGSLGPALRKDGQVELDRNGKERPTSGKYGASTTWMGKLLYRLNAGRNGACPVLAVRGQENLESGIGRDKAGCGGTETLNRKGLGRNWPGGSIETCV